MNFNEIIKTNKSNIKNIIKLITKSENEDLEQEVYIKLWKIQRNIKKEVLSRAGSAQSRRIPLKII